MTLAGKRRALIAVTAALATLVVAVQYQPKVADALDPEAADGQRRRLRRRQRQRPPGRPRARARRRPGLRRRADRAHRRRGPLQPRHRHRSPHHRHRLHHPAGGLRGADRRVHDAALLPRARAARRRRAGHGRLRAPARPQEPRRLVQLRQHRRPARQPGHGRADRADQRDLAEPRVHPGLRRPHQQRHRRRVPVLPQRDRGVEAAGLAGGRQPRVLRRRPADLRRADRQLPALRGAGVVLVRLRQPPFRRLRQLRRGAVRRAARVGRARPRGQRARQARRRADAPADERPVRGDRRPTTSTASCSSTTRPSSCSSATSTPTTPTPSGSRAPSTSRPTRPRTRSTTARAASATCTWRATASTTRSGCSASSAR